MCAPSNQVGWQCAFLPGDKPDAGGPGPASFFPEGFPCLAYGVRLGRFHRTVPKYPFFQGLTFPVLPSLVTLVFAPPFSRPLFGGFLFPYTFTNRSSETVQSCPFIEAFQPRLGTLFIDCFRDLFGLFFLQPRVIFLFFFIVRVFFSPHSLSTAVLRESGFKSPNFITPFPPGGLPVFAVVVFLNFPCCIVQ